MPFENVRDNLRLQFTLFTAMIVFIAVTIEYAVSSCFYVSRFWTYVIAIIFAVACFIAQRGKSPDIAWACISIGWLVTLFDFIVSLNKTFPWSWGGQYVSLPTAYQMREEFWYVYDSTIILSFVLTLPAVYLAATASANSKSHSRKWLMACPVIAFANCMLVFVYLLFLTEYMFPK